MEIFGIINPFIEVILGILLLIFRNSFIRVTDFLAKFLFRKTHFSIYKYQMDATRTSSMRSGVIIVGSFFIVLGILQLVF
jgi:hypothetical protein